MFIDDMVNLFHDKDITLSAYCIGGMLGFSFENDEDNTIFKQFFKFMLQNGVYFAPSAYESAFISTCHTKEDMEYVLTKVREFKLN